MTTFSNTFTSKLSFLCLIFIPVYRIDQAGFDLLKEDKEFNYKLKCNFNGLLTMLIKYFTNAINDEQHYKCQLYMSSDSSAQFFFHQILEFKSIVLLRFNMKLGDEDEINNHVIYKYKMVQHALNQSRTRLDQICEILKIKNPTLIHQVNKAAKIDQPYMRGVNNDLPIDYLQQQSFRSIKSKAFSQASKFTNQM